MPEKLDVCELKGWHIRSEIVSLMHWWSLEEQKRLYEGHHYIGNKGHRSHGSSQLPLFARAHDIIIQDLCLYS
jgi:hypothetical protein